MRLRHLSLDGQRLPHDFLLPAQLESVSLNDCSLRGQPLHRLTRLRTLQLETYVEDLDSLAALPLDALSMRMRPELVGLSLPVTGLDVLSSHWSDLSALLEVFPRLGFLRLREWEEPFEGTLQPQQHLVLELRHLQKLPRWTSRCIPSPEMMRQRCRLLKDVPAVTELGAAHWRSMGHRWATRGALDPGQRIPFIKDLQLLTRWTLAQAKRCSDALLDQTADAYTISEALRAQALWTRSGVPCTLTPW